MELAEWVLFSYYPSGLISLADEGYSLNSSSSPWWICATLDLLSQLGSTSSERRPTCWEEVSLTDYCFQATYPITMACRHAGFVLSILRL